LPDFREAYQVTIYERANDAGGEGAAIALGPTALRMHETLGFDQELAGSLPAGLIKHYDHKGKPGYEKHVDK
jgi:2-polyprenyl-6-methoxyphenol hydroxylase-like FAD-dependent oxidoreductase